MFRRFWNSSIFFWKSSILTKKKSFQGDVPLISNWVIHVDILNLKFRGAQINIVVSRACRRGPNPSRESVFWPFFHENIQKMPSQVKKSLIKVVRDVKFDLGLRYETIRTWFVTSRAKNCQNYCLAGIFLMKMIIKASNKGSNPNILLV